jgi:hypothetical protein
MVRRALILLVALAAAGVVFVGPVTGAGAAGSDLDTVSHSAQALEAAGSTQFAGTVVVAAGRRGATQTARISGTFDFRNRRGEFHVDASALGTAGARGRITLLLVDNVAYLNAAALSSSTAGASPLLAGKQWVSLDLTAITGQQVLSQLDPSGAVGVIRGLTSVTRVGAATVRGAATTQYRVRIDLQKAVADSADLSPLVQQAVRNLGTGVIPAQAWVDHQGRLRRFALQVTPVIGSTRQHVNESFDFFNLGLPVSVTAPPSDQVVDFTQLLAGLGGQQGSGSGSVTSPTG